MTHDSSFSRRQLLPALLLMPASLTALQPPQSTASRVVAAFRRAYEAMDDLALEEVMSPALLFDDPTFQLHADSFDAMRPMIANAKRTFRSGRIVVEHEFTCGEWVVARQQQHFVPIAEPRREISVRGVSLFRVRDSKIIEWHDYYDAVGFARQMGGR